MPTKLKHPELIALSGQLSIRAGRGKGKLATFSMVANSGQPMELEGYKYPVVIDLDGVQFAKDNTPIVADHNSALRVGHATSQKISGGKILVSGVVSSNSKTARGFVEDSKNGFPFEASVGAKILPGGAEIFHADEDCYGREDDEEEEDEDDGDPDDRFISQQSDDDDHEDADSEDDDDSSSGYVQVNGRKFPKPLIVARKTLVREISITTLGADAETSAVAARARGANMVRRRTRTEDDVDADRDNVAAEEERVDNIRAAFKRNPTVQQLEVTPGKYIRASAAKSRAIREGWPVEKVELALLRAAVPNPGYGDDPGNMGPGIHVVPDTQSMAETGVLGEALACCLCRNQFAMPTVARDTRGRKLGLEDQFSEAALEASESRNLRGITLQGLLRMVCHATGQSAHLAGDDLIRAAFSSSQKIQAASIGPFSTLTVTNILESASNKYLLMRFFLQQAAWPEICRVRSLNDFKPTNLYRLDENIGYLKVGSDGELKSATLSDSKRTIQPETYGRLIALNRQNIRNDDLNAFQQVLIGLAEGSVWQVESSVFTLLLTNAIPTSIPTTTNAFFSAANGNYQTYTLGLHGLRDAETLFRRQVSPSKKPIMVNPDRLLVGTKNALFGAQLFGSERLLAGVDVNGSQVFQTNPFKDKYRVIVSAFLDNTAILTPEGHAIPNQSDFIWFLLGDPAIGAVLDIGFLDGRQVPFIEQGQTSFSTLGIQWRGYHDFGVAQGDPQYGVMSSGTGCQSAH